MTVTCNFCRSCGAKLLPVSITGGLAIEEGYRWCVNGHEQEGIVEVKGMTAELNCLRTGLGQLRKKHYEEGVEAHNLLIDSLLDMVKGWI